MLKFKKSGFTLVEVILACSIFAIVVSWIILAINRSFVFMDNIKLSVRATNLAREWVEMMYNMRDTNRRKHSWGRDKYWLNLWNGNNDIFVEWIYVLKEKENNEDGNMYLSAEHLSKNWNSTKIGKFYSNDGFWETDETAKNKAKLKFDWQHYSYYELNEETWERDSKEWDVGDVLVWNWLEFYRIVRVFGVYEKNTDESDVKMNYSTQSEKFTNWTPAEMRFCVKVFYRSTWQHATELCGVITNFKE